ncbi:glutamate/aspartate ABC transporter substrate-binding protein [Ralstonia sp. SET104]|uniref:glutamate/aspartate ABC transporter substrate-binding protein n=1 Tax=Ralstonia sp. SET104 TaxID=2448774 RepID=UPI000F56E6B6|nr:glutamate/aspartate ABC transporter substrate-binding protein [Ralstonia sp. SET104]GCB03494.1 glutamate/aspartate ABC transporter substrate-binding protein [Ralstonia sp. SET104]
MKTLHSTKRILGGLTLAAAGALTLAMLSTSAQAQSNDTLAKIKQSGVISVGYRESSIPFSYQADANTITGYSQEISNMIVAGVEKKLGVPKLQVKLTPITSQNRISLLQNGTIDFECGSTTNNLERQKQVAFSNNIFIYGMLMLVNKKSGIKDFSDLKGKTVVTTAGTTEDRILQKMNGEAKDADKMNLILAKDHGQAFLTLESGRAVAFVMDEPLLYGERTKAKNQADWVVTGTPLQTETYACMMRKDDPAFKKVADDVIADLMKSGRANKLYEKWFMQPIPPKNLNLNYPMTAGMKDLYAHPNDKAIQ